MEDSYSGYQRMSRSARRQLEDGAGITVVFDSGSVSVVEEATTRRVSSRAASQHTKTPTIATSTPRAKANARTPPVASSTPRTRANTAKPPVSLPSRAASQNFKTITGAHNSRAKGKNATSSSTKMTCIDSTPNTRASASRGKRSLTVAPINTSSSTAADTTETRSTFGRTRKAKLTYSPSNSTAPNVDHRSSPAVETKKNETVAKNKTGAVRNISNGRALNVRSMTAQPRTAKKVISAEAHSTIDGSKSAKSTNRSRSQTMKPIKVEEEIASMLPKSTSRSRSAAFDNKKPTSACVELCDVEPPKKRGKGMLAIKAEPVDVESDYDTVVNTRRRKPASRSVPSTKERSLHNVTSDHNVTPARGRTNNKKRVISFSIKNEPMDYGSTDMDDTLDSEDVNVKPVKEEVPDDYGVGDEKPSALLHDNQQFLTDRRDAISRAHLILNDISSHGLSYLEMAVKCLQELRNGIRVELHDGNSMDVADEMVIGADGEYLQEDSHDSEPIVEDPDSEDEVVEIPHENQRRSMPNSGFNYMNEQPLNNINQTSYGNQYVNPRHNNGNAYRPHNVDHNQPSSSSVPFVNARVIRVEIDQRKRMESASVRHGHEMQMLGIDSPDVPMIVEQRIDRQVVELPDGRQIIREVGQPEYTHIDAATLTPAQRRYYMSIGYEINAMTRADRARLGFADPPAVGRRRNRVHAIEE